MATKENKHLQSARQRGVLTPDDLSKLCARDGLASLCPLYYAGNLDILNDKAIGFCGSRDVSEKGSSLAADCAEQAVKEDLAIISGYARGVDRIVHEVALKNKGKTIAVLPLGLDNFSIHSTLRDCWDWNRVLVLSQFPCNAVWRVHHAMERNGLIIRLVDAMIVIEARDKGGTVRAGEESLKRGVPLYVSVYGDEETQASSGNRLLLKQGARRLMKSNKEGRANMHGIFETISNPARQDHSEVQLPLDYDRRRIA